jgi:hypothetical protein
VLATPDSVGIQDVNSTSGVESVMNPDRPRQCYLPMPPVPGRPILPDGIYPVDYDDLCNLSGMFLLLVIPYSGQHTH